jgi:hypothetical protein
VDVLEIHKAHSITADLHLMSGKDIRELETGAADMQKTLDKTIQILALQDCWLLEHGV